MQTTHAAQTFSKHDVCCLQHKITTFEQIAFAIFRFPEFANGCKASPDNSHTGTVVAALGIGTAHLGARRAVGVLFIAENGGVYAAGTPHIRSDQSVACRAIHMRACVRIATKLKSVPG